MSDMNTLDLEPGNIVGGYTLVSRLGGGAMGTVWRVKDDGGQIYAMKILRDSFAEEDAGEDPGSAESRERATARERFRREGLALKRIDHPGVCQIVDMELDDSLAFIVTELVNGLNLRDDVRDNGPYVGEDLARLAEKLIDAVDAVHAAGIIHRDIKPTNVMISARGPILVDFGIAMGEGESHVTRTGLVMGTPGFIAPEIIDGAESDEATDWWSVASVLGFAAMGEPVYGTKPMMAVLEREAAGNANLSGLPPRTTYMLREALDPDRMKRCSAQELLHTIRQDAMEGAWEEDSGDPGTDEVVPPFYSSSAGPANPRKLWTDPVADPAGGTPAADGTPGNADGHDGRTRILASHRYPLIHDVHDGSTEALSSASIPGETQIIQPDTPAAGRESRSSYSGDPMKEDTYVSPTRVYRPDAPDISAPRTELYPQGYAQAPLPSPAMMPVQAAQPAYSQMQMGQPLLQPAFTAPPAMQQNPVIPAEQAMWWYRRHSLLPIVITAAPLALLAAAAPCISFIFTFLIFWGMAAAGYAAQARERRRENNGGVFKRSDNARTLIGLPWNAAKGLIPAAGAAAVGWAGWAATLAFLSLVCNAVSGYTHVSLKLGSEPSTLFIPLPAGRLASLSGGILVLSFLAGWTCALASRPALIIRCGFGAVRNADIPGYPQNSHLQDSRDSAGGYSPQSIGGSSSSQSKALGIRRKTLVSAITWLIAVLIAAGYILPGIIDWAPLVVSYAG